MKKRISFVVVLLTFMACSAGHKEKLLSSQVQVKLLSSIVEESKKVRGYYPNSKDGLKSLSCTMIDEPCSNLSPYDPWGNDINYVSPGVRNKASHDL